jgi:hypothetical protein
VPQKVLIDGQVYFDIQKDQEMRKRMAEERKALEEKDRQTREKERPCPPGKPGGGDAVKDTTRTEVPPQGDEGE